MQIHPSVLDLARIFFGNSWSRTGSFLAAAGATALLGWLDQLAGYFLGIDIEQPPTWVGFAVMFTGIALLMWGYSRPSSSSAPNPHDVELIAKFRGLLTENVLDFLRNHNFGAPWKRSMLDPIAELAEAWDGARYEFDDQTLNSALSKVKSAANRLEEMIALGSWPTHNNAEIQTVKTDEDYAIGTQPGTIKKIKEMNDAATALVKEIDGLERLAKARLR